MAPWRPRWTRRPSRPRCAPSWRRGEYDAVAICLLNSFANPAHERAVAAPAARRRPRPRRHLQRGRDAGIPGVRARQHHGDVRLCAARAGCLSRPDRGPAGAGRVHRATRGDAVERRQRADRGDATQCGPPPCCPARRAGGGGRGAPGRAVRVPQPGHAGYPAAPARMSAWWRTGAPAWPARAKWAACRYRCRLDITTVGAGGGSLAWVDDGGPAARGPRSAGADPGPACYGRGGAQPTLTDAQVLCGRIPPPASGWLAAW